MKPAKREHTADELRWSALVCAPERGMSRTEFCQATGIGYHDAHRILTRMRERGLIASTRQMGALSRWTSPERAESLSDEILADAREREQAWKHGYYKKMIDLRAQKARERQAKAAAAEPPSDDWMPTRIIVNASEAAPMRPTGPRSVFELAMA